MVSNHCNLLLDYYNNSLTEQEKVQFEEHITSCKSCQEELQELIAITEDFPYLSAPIDPPQGMKNRVLSNVFEEGEHSKDNTEKAIHILPKRKRRSLSVASLAAALLLSLIGNIYLYGESRQSSEQLQEKELATLIKEVQLSSTTNNTMIGKASLVDKDGVLNVVLTAEQLPKTKGEEVYQVWLLEDGKPYRAGSFVPNDNGSGLVTFEMKLEGNHDWDTVAVTLEPDINSNTPLGDIVLASEL
ncbi:anti-sigma factor [Bacillus sp. BGMRC 2118]|nr:anti-sigma factor [Bacillus sp. BGMRC 2118]